MTLIFYLTPVRLAIIRKEMTTNASEDMQGGKPYSQLAQLHTGAATTEISVRVPQRTKNTSTV